MTDIRRLGALRASEPVIQRACVDVDCADPSHFPLSALFDRSRRADAQVEPGRQTA